MTTTKQQNPYSNPYSNNRFATIDKPKMSEWQCYLFGGRPGVVSITWRPHEGEEPNWFWRKMQYLILGNLWVKDK
jgi:hypothetical protein